MRRDAGRLYEIPCMIAAVAIVIAAVLPPLVERFAKKHDAVAPVDSTAVVTSGS